MEFYFFILIILFLTAIADLTVGVANDAVNFLNSAVGSRAGRRTTILVVASLGVLIGTTFSGGIMEVARKGIFNPEFFVFHEVMLMFLAVMMTDIILLDVYNTFGLPTSTTVSIVFALIGASVGMAGLKVVAAGAPATDILQYLNAANVLAIVSSIGLSVVVSFFFGSLVQFLTRLLFTFRFEKRVKRYGAVWCALALTTITYFILVKGAKGSTLLSSENVQWIQENPAIILGGSLVLWTLLFQFIILFTRINVLKVIVLAGTFALALAFAANDLVNFVGAPLAALGAYDIASAHPSVDPGSLTMEGLAGKLSVSTWILLFSGAVMVTTLWISRKSRTVTRTEISLGRQEEGFERFGATPFSRGVVRLSRTVFGLFRASLPEVARNWIADRVNPAEFKPQRTPDGEVQLFDHLRAAVNLTVASAIISLGTAFKLPLSTTFVTFMVAMSTSMVDGSWGRESAVYRVNGVITVIAGWFFTAFMAFATAALFAIGLFFGGVFGVIGIVVLGLGLFWRTSLIHRKREAVDERMQAESPEGKTEGAREGIKREVAGILSDTRRYLDDIVDGLVRDKRKPLREALKASQRITKDIDKAITGIFRLIRMAGDESALGSQYAQQIATLQILGANVSSLAEASFTHVDNNHHPPDKSQSVELNDIRGRSSRILKTSAETLRKGLQDDAEGLPSQLVALREKVLEYDRNQMKRINLGKSGTRNSLAFLGAIAKTERIAEQAAYFVELSRDAESATLKVLG